MDDHTGSAISPEELNSSVHAQEVRSFRYGEYVVEEGGISNQFAAILSGQVLVQFRGKKVRVLGEHDVLGLESLFFKKPSAISAMALTSCRIAFYGPEALHHFLRNDARMSDRLIKSLVQQLVQTTQRIVDRDREFSLDDAKMRFFNNSEVVIGEGSHLTEFYKLVSTEGGLLVTIQGKEIARLSKPGEFFGEMEALLSLPSQATVTSSGQSVVQVYPSNQLPMMVELYPDVALQMIRNLASRLLDINRRFVAETA